MTDEALIAQQTRTIASQGETLKGYRGAMASIRRNIVCIGGPLNDNIRGYSMDQLVPFQTILNLTESVDDPEGA